MRSASKKNSIIQPLTIQISEEPQTNNSRTESRKNQKQKTKKNKQPHSMTRFSTSTHPNLNLPFHTKQTQKFNNHIYIHIYLQICKKMRTKSHLHILGLLSIQPKQKQEGETHKSKPRSFHHDKSSKKTQYKAFQ